MTIHTQSSNSDDASLVALCVEGDTVAFRTIVERYQSLVCALTYAGCGDRHQSEDLAQETFLHAWKGLATLKEPSHLRPWLCSIARNLVCSARRKERRAPVTQTDPTDETLDALSSSPPEEAISREEQAILWETLKQLPEDYREPLVLYYRQEESIASVAASLDISEPAARQRLSRGRAMLTHRIESVIRRGLRSTAPTKAFTLAVISTIPGITVSASAAAAGTATMSATAVKSGASAKVAASVGALVMSLVGPLVGLAGGYLGYRIGLDQTIAPEEHRFMRRFFWGLMLIIAVFTGILVSSKYWTEWWGLRQSAKATILISIAVSYVLLLLILCLICQRRIRRLRTDAIADNPNMLAKAQEMATHWNREYRSRRALLGLPLVHINIGGTPDGHIPVAKGWIALGAKAYGLVFACGGLAIAPISFGGFSVGLLAWGGFAIGVFTFGGFGLGIWALGGLAIGWKAIGGCALAWHAGQGGAAIARDFAQGTVAVAKHANDAVAEAFFRKDGFFQFAHGSIRYAHWAWLLGIIALIPILTQWIAYRKASKSDQGQTIE